MIQPILVLFMCNNHNCYNKIMEISFRAFRKIKIRFLQQGLPIIECQNNIINKYLLNNSIKSLLKFINNFNIILKFNNNFNKTLKFNNNFSIGHNRIFRIHLKLVFLLIIILDINNNLKQIILNLKCNKHSNLIINCPIHIVNKLLNRPSQIVLLFSQFYNNNKSSHNNLMKINHNKKLIRIKYLPYNQIRIYQILLQNKILINKNLFKIMMKYLKMYLKVIKLRTNQIQHFIMVFGVQNYNLNKMKYYEKLNLIYIHLNKYSIS